MIACIGWLIAIPLHENIDEHYYLLDFNGDQHSCKHFSNCPKDVDKCDSY
jgi:hypothetical protein